YAAGEAIPGAVLAIETLRSEGVQIRFATNTTRQPRSALVQRLRGFGIEAVADDLVTAPLAAVAWLRAQGVQSVALYLSEATHSEFQGFTLTEDSPDAVV
ncbi:MAG: TIGR01458 family HAD-type hydrolase, partial [Gammaproteobacteria bacterium]|nr:TIGR01458 family HAD-type hydrolase [Gammaproteobacteria bacterium]NIV52948.1 TIGR01458 family HAD-type hydrolase [Gammaproteobacteria bacterium]